MASKPTWFRMSAENGVGEINIFGDIGAWGITFEDFQRELDALGPVSEINIKLNSDGGDVFAGFGIFNALRLSGARVNITVMGIAASIASVILMAGDKRIMPSNAMIMIHNPVGMIVGEADELVSYGEAVAAMRDKIAQIYADASGGALTVKAALSLMDKQTWLTAERAIELGLATAVAEPMKMAAHIESKWGVASLKDSALQGGDHIEKDSAMTTKPDAKPDAKDAPAVDTAAIDAAVTAERARISDITAACKLAGHPDKADAFVKDGKTLAEVISALAAIPVPAADPKAKAKAKDDVELSARHGVETEPSAPVVIDEQAIWDNWNKRKSA